MLHVSQCLKSQPSGKLCLLRNSLTQHVITIEVCSGISEVVGWRLGLGLHGQTNTPLGDRARDRCATQTASGQVI